MVSLPLFCFNRQFAHGDVARANACTCSPESSDMCKLNLGAFVRLKATSKAIKFVQAVKHFGFKLLGPGTTLKIV